MQLHGRPRVMAFLSIMTGVLILSGCAAVHTSTAKKDLGVQTKMSDTVFLDPIGPDKKVVFVQVRNTSDKPFDIVRTYCDCDCGTGLAYYLES
jgi:Enterobacterial TraT complement resistance protein